ncbi:MAG TPA: hypothetical protein EYP07_17135 [Kiloniellaceae bacterium]|nr:hypothetical protein [Kiloniellaceae bacterium]
MAKATRFSLSDGERQAIADLVGVLARGAFEDLVRDGRAGRLSAAELKRVIAQYGRRLTELPGSAFDLADCYRLEDKPEKLAIDLPLWTVEDGRSDLTLSLTLQRMGSEIALRIDDLHVL